MISYHSNCKVLWFKSDGPNGQACCDKWNKSGGFLSTSKKCDWMQCMIKSSANCIFHIKLAEINLKTQVTNKYWIDGEKTISLYKISG